MSNRPTPDVVARLLSGALGAVPRSCRGDRAHGLLFCCMCGAAEWRCSRPLGDGEVPDTLYEARDPWDGDHLCERCLEFRDRNGAVFDYLTRVAAFLVFQSEGKPEAPTPGVAP